MTSRRSRQKANESSVEDALAEMKRLKEQGKSRIDEFDESEEDIYEYLEDEDYSKHVAKERERAKRFIITTDSDTRDYVDDGEELWVQERERTEKENKPKRSNKKEEKQQTRNISSLLLKGSTKQSAPKKKEETIRKTVMSADALDSYLDDFDSNPFDNNVPISTPVSKNTKSVPFVTNPVTNVNSENVKVISEDSKENIQQISSTLEIEEDSISDDAMNIDNDESENVKVEEEIDTSQTTIQFKTKDPSEKTCEIIPKPIVSTTSVLPETKKPSKQIEKVEQSDWFHMCDDENNENDDSTESDTMDLDPNMVSLSNEETIDSKHIFLLDATYEQNIPGTVVLFGKYLNPEEGNKSQSCCVRVQNLYRTLYFLPRVFKATKSIHKVKNEEDGTMEDVIEWNEDKESPVSIRDVCNEFNQIRKNYGIKEFRAKPVKRKYCFNLPNVPREEREYVKIQFKETSQTKKLSNFELQGNTFSHVFCVQQSLLENVILKQKLMGPQWIKVNNLTNVDKKFSWCKHEWSVDDVSDIIPLSGQNVPPPPSLVVLSLKVNTILNHRKQANEIVVASAMVHQSVSIDTPTSQWEKGLSSFTAIRKLDGIPWPMNFQQQIKNQSTKKRQLYCCESELTLLNSLMNFISSVDPDVIVGHNYIGFDLDVLLHRMKANNVSIWSRLGRLQRRHMPKLQSGAGGQRDSTWEERKISAGRLICDTYLASKDLAMIRQASYSLSSLAEKQLDMVRYEIDQDNLHEYFRNGFSSKLQLKNSKSNNNILDDHNLDFLIKHNENDTYLQLALMFKFQILPLTKQLTNLSGNLWAKSLTGSRAERISFYLLHEFHNRKYIIPDKIGFQEATSRKKKASYSGGLVLAPKRGFYDQLILLLDFNSLYPSLIQEYNICFTTIDPKAKYTDDGSFIPIEELPDTNEKGVLPIVLKALIDRRRTVKQMIKSEKDSIKLQQLDIKQKALKLTANSMYGCLGFPQSRFYAMPLAELITRKGREALRLSKAIAEDKLGYDVVYGDTDSIMVATGTTDVPKAKEIATLIKKTINQKYTQLELDLDGIFKTMLLLKKKKYAALMLGDDGVSTIKETKGLDLVRRDWCPLSKTVGSKILDFILSGNQIDEVILSIHDYLREISKKIYEIPLDEFVISKSLSKEPEQYSKSTPLPHVTVALALINQGKSVRVGNHIPYVICNSLDEETTCSYALRAYHPEHIQKAGGLLEIDYEWYLENQILAPVLRLCGPIEGTNPIRIAQCLGIENSKLASRFSGESNYDDNRFFKPVSLDEYELYKDSDPFIIECNNCHTKFPFKSIIYKSSNSEDKNDEYITGHTCTNENCQLELDYSVVVNQLHLFIRKHIQQYYSGWLICDDPSCSHRTRTILLKSGQPKCPISRCGGKMKQEYSSSRLFNQLGYLQMKFDMIKFKESSTSSETKILADAYSSFYNALNKVLQEYLSRNAHNFVDCEQLFSCFSQLTL